MANEVAKRQETAVAEPTTMLTMIERLAQSPDFPVEKLEKLLDMQERIMAKQAETEFNAAMTAAQSEMGRVSADGNNPQTRSKYATYGKLDKVLRPIYTKQGFALSFDTAEPPAPEVVRVVCHVSHRAGHSRRYQVDMPADGKGAKGGDVMTKTHAAGAAMSYGMRYLLKFIFNVAIGEEDTDGNAPLSERITEQQVADLNSLIEEVGVDKARFLKWARVQSLDQIHKNAYAECVRQIERKRKA